ncbi:MAG TPA: sugar phosphate nucleotidyltransferase [Longimicrobiales bacterium]|nr:sugar phosphate nucleotidyltransferase [Longimicrobiales bacterium]
MPASRNSSLPDANLWAVILAGGVGSRFWPVSTPARPKQLLPLAGHSPLILQTVARITPLVPLTRVRVLTGERLAGPILAAVPALGRAQLLLEPAARGTAPALAWAAHTIAQVAPSAVMVSLHSDHVIEPGPDFRAVVQRAAALSQEQGRLITLGARPTRAETGYGYIAPGEALTADGAVRSVARFVEKPAAAMAERYIEEGCLWNTGIFIWPVRLLLAELAQHTPELAALLPLLDAGDVAAFFAQAPQLSIDEGLLERSDNVGVVRADFRWDDVGAWDAVGRNRAADGAGNVAEGAAHFVDAHDNIAWSDDGSIVVFGVDDLVVVRSGGITFVARRDRTPDLKQLLAQLPPELRGGPG